MKLAATAVVLMCVASMSAQRDPGPRPGPAAAGKSYPSLDAASRQRFANGAEAVNEIDSVSGTLEPGKGLGPTFNGNSCAQCHAEPAVGGSSPGVNSKINPVQNPQIALATLDGAHNTIPVGISWDGPVREIRFRSDGGVHGLYTIAGRFDAPGCKLAQPDFNGEKNSHGISFRIPTPTFGLGLVENTPDAVLIANLNATATQRKALGIGGALNLSGNDGTIARFGWKAQNKSLLMFAGEAYNVEQGVSNELFTNERSAVSGCVYNGTPEDHAGAEGTDEQSDLTGFADFMRLLAPPTPASQSTSAKDGAILFSQVGCALCHSQTLTTAKSIYPGLDYATYHPYSDFAVHHMGSGLSDGISQGQAGPDQFRTAPLWGAGQRLFWLHDGRTTDLMQAISAHASSGSEANSVINKFNSLSSQQKQSLLDFLRSL